MRRLNRREKTLIVVFAAVAVLAGVSMYTSPSEEPDPEALMAYYVDAFSGADTMTIRSAAEEVEPITVTREEAPRLFSRLMMAVRYAQVVPSPSPHAPKWVLDVTTVDGSKVNDIGVSLHLEAPKQPAKGVYWVVPRSPGQHAPEPIMVQIIDDYVDSLHAGTADKSAE